jgi:predicted acylesterase/phospholipase RssA
MIFIVDMAKSLIHLRICLATASLLLSGCASVERLPPADNMHMLSEIPGMPDIRFWGDEPPVNSAQRTAVLRQQITSAPGYDPEAPVHFLAISGGGQKGAFGAGLLTGWTASGTRPEFRLVTGISTGALIAPFAFLGPDYDNVIRELYTRFSTKDVLEPRFVSGLFSADSITDNNPLRDILKKHLTPVELDKIAEAHQQGRRLFVGTTHLDVQRPVIWDLGAIASSGHPSAHELVIDVMLASTAIPGAFPPIYVQATQNGILHDELHVDGGVTTQVFLSPVAFNMEDALKQAGLYGPAHVYLIRNSQIMPEVLQVKPKTVHILAQSLSTLLRAQAMGDMYRIYQDAQLNNIAYHAAYIPSEFRAEPDEIFDEEYMGELFDFAYHEARAGYPWEKSPPELRFPSSRDPQ